MMQSEQFVEAWWQNDSFAHHDVGIYISNLDSFDYFPSPTVSLENSSDSIPFDSTLDLNGFLGSVDDVLLEDLCDWMESDHQSTPASSSQQSCVDGAGSIVNRAAVDQLPALVLPAEEMEIDTQLSILYLLKAYGEAMEMEQSALAGEILKRLREKGCPLGAPVERLAYYFLRAVDSNEDEYLRQESNKNYQAAFAAFYRIFPFGRFAHLAANSMILDSIPDDAEVVRIVDFDVGEGVQWVPLIDDLGRRHNNVVHLTYLKWEEQNCCSDVTKKHLCEYAQSVGVTLIVKETSMEGVMSEMKRRGGGRREWVAFNCMVGIPHMGRSRSITHVSDFLKLAKYSIESNDKRGVIAFGEGRGAREGGGFEEEMVRVKAMFEAMEWHVPVEHAEARMAMEAMFVGGSVEKWEEGKRRVEPSEIGMEGVRVSKRNVMEAKEVIREGESMYWVTTQGLNHNEIVLGCMGTSLLTVSSWR